MAVWLVRAGAKGEHEQKFIDDKRIYLTKRLLNSDVSLFAQRDELITVMTSLYRDDKPRKVSNLASQVWSFGHTMEAGDLVVLPSKFKPAVYLGKITSDYLFDSDAEHPYYHWREVNWLPEPILRSDFSKELLQSFSAAMTICQIKKHNAEQRLQEIWQRLAD